MSNKICKCGHDENEHQELIGTDHKSACFHETDEIGYCSCMNFEEDLQAHLKQIETNYDALQTPMPCGHLARYAVNGEEGTQYCVMCDRNALLEQGEKALEFIQQAKQHFKEIQWNGESGGWLACPSCHKLKKDGHSNDCTLMLFVGETNHE